MEVSEKFENIICPICNGNGKIKHSRRISYDEDEYWEEKCNYCKGKRIVKRRTLVEDMEVNDLKIDTDNISTRLRMFDSFGQ